MTTSLQQALAARAVLLDGGLSTELERRGHDVSGDLWSAALLASDPDEIQATHAAFFAAGARVATTASYQASLEGFAAAGIDRQQAQILIARSVRLAQQARAEAGLDGEAWVAGSVGPYGAVLAGGQEYTGVYPAPFDTVAALRAFHRPRLELLLAAGADVLACETVPSLVEVEALLAELDALGAPAWVSLTTVTDDAGRVLTRRGEDAGEGFAMVADVRSVIAVGVNCTAPSGVAAAVTLAGERSGLPGVAYPNSGETWDAERRVWSGRPGLDPTQAREWARAGARLIGGCCRIGPGDIAALADLGLTEEELRRPPSRGDR